LRGQGEKTVKNGERDGQNFNNISSGIRWAKMVNTHNPFRIWQSVFQMEQMAELS